MTKKTNNHGQAAALEQGQKAAGRQLPNAKERKNKTELEMWKNSTQQKIDLSKKVD